VVVSGSLVKRRLQAWKKWLIGGSVAAAAVVTACLAWRSRNKGVSQEPVVRHQKKQLLENKQESSVVAREVPPALPAVPASSVPPVPPKVIDYKAQDEKNAKIIEAVITSSNDEALTNSVQQLYQQQVGAGIIDKVVDFAKVDRVKAQKMLVALQTIFYIPYTVTAVKCVEEAPECPVCSEHQPVSYLFCSTDGKVADVWCKDCWNKCVDSWVPGESTSRGKIKDMVIAVLADHINTYKIALTAQIEGVQGFLKDLNNAQQRSFIKRMDEEEPCDCKPSLGEALCQCSSYREKRKSFTPQQRLKEALVVGASQDASNNRKVVAQLVKNLCLTL